MNPLATLTSLTAASRHRPRFRVPDPTGSVWHPTFCSQEQAQLVRAPTAEPVHAGPVLFSSRTCGQGLPYSQVARGDPSLLAPQTPRTRWDRGLGNKALSEQMTRCPGRLVLKVLKTRPKPQEPTLTFSGNQPGKTPGGEILKTGTPAVTGRRWFSHQSVRNAVVT